MNWTSYAIQDLKRYRGLKNSLITIPERIRALEDIFKGYKASTYDRIPTQGGASCMQDFLVENMAERNELAEILISNKRLINIIESGLSVLDKAEYEVLSKFYISPCKDCVEVLRTELSFERAYIYKLKEKALRKYILQVYGVAIAERKISG